MKSFENGTVENAGSNKEIKFKKLNPVLIGIGNIAKFILTEYYVFLKEPDLDFKNLSAETFILELNKYKGKKRKILLKKHSLIINQIGDKWQEISTTHSFLSDGDKIVQYLVNNGWQEEAAKSNLNWLISETCATLYLSSEGVEKAIVALRDNHDMSDIMIGIIFEELSIGHISMASISMNNGLKIYF